MKRMFCAAFMALLAIAPAHAIEVRDIIEFGAAIPACLDIQDAHEIRLIEAQSKNSFGQQTIYGRTMVHQYIAEKRIKTDANNSMPACYWINAGEARYVAEKRTTGAKGFAQGIGMTNTAYFCMGFLVGNTDNEDRTKPCLWVFMADRPTKNGQFVPPPAREEYPQFIDPLNPPFPKWSLCDLAKRNGRQCD
jgi:hypothetical protein